MNEYEMITIEYNVSGDIVTDARIIIDTAQKAAYSAVNVALIQRNLKNTWKFSNQ